MGVEFNLAQSSSGIAGLLATEEAWMTLLDAEHLPRVLCHDANCKKDSCKAAQAHLKKGWSAELLRKIQTSKHDLLVPLAMLALERKRICTYPDLKLTFAAAGMQNNDQEALMLLLIWAIYTMGKSLKQDDFGVLHALLNGCPPADTGAQHTAMELGKMLSDDIKTMNDSIIGRLGTGIHNIEAELVTGRTTKHNILEWMNVFEGMYKTWAADNTGQFRGRATLFLKVTLAAAPRAARLDLDLQINVAADLENNVAEPDPAPAAALLTDEPAAPVDEPAAAVNDPAAPAPVAVDDPAGAAAVDEPAVPAEPKKKRKSDTPLGRGLRNAPRAICECDGERREIPLPVGCTSACETCKNPANRVCTKCKVLCDECTM